MINVTSIKKVSLGMLAASVVSLLAACSSGSGGGASGSPPATDKQSAQPSASATASAAPVDKTPTTITISTWVPADSPEWHKISDAFTKKYPWITVKWLFNGPGADTIKAVTQSIAAGDPIDIFWNNTFFDVVSQGLAESLTPMIKADSEFQKYQFNKGIMEPFQYKGQQYGLSRGNDTFIFFYNKDILAKYGIDPPKNDWSWQDLKDMAKKAIHPEDKIWGLSNNSIFMQFASVDVPAANGHADHIMDLNGDMSTKISFAGADKNVMDDHQFIMDWVAKDGIMLNEKRQKDAGIEGDAFATGHAAFFYHVSPTIPGFKNQWKFNWDIAPTPKGTAKQVGTSFNNPMFLSKASKHKSQAFEFMKFWAATVDGQKILMDIGGSLANSPAPEITDYFKQLQTYKGLNVDALLYASKIGEVDPTIYIPGGAAVGAAFGGWAGDQYKNEGSAYDYFPTIADKTNKDIADALAQAK